MCLTAQAVLTHMCHVKSSLFNDLIIGVKHILLVGLDSGVSGLVTVWNCGGIILWTSPGSVDTS